jgi:ribokinase
MRVAVVGHVEWVRFLPVDAAPYPGAIVHAEGPWEEAAGGGGVAAAELARLAGTATLHTVLGADPAGTAAAEQLAGLGVVVRGARYGAQRCALTLIDPSGERTIVVIGTGIGPGLAPGSALDPADFAGVDAVYFCKGDAAALRAARAARVLVATARILPVLQAAGVTLDALVHSARDAGERYAPGDLVPAPRLVATTEGAEGGRYTTSEPGAPAGRWSPVVPGPTAASGDAYGAGDTFAAALTFALARQDAPAAALAFAAGRAAAALGRRGAHGLPSRQGRADAEVGRAVAPVSPGA